MKGTLSILGLWMYDQTIFDNMRLPSGVDRDTVRDTILSSFGDLEILYPSAPFMKTMIELWSKKELPVWNRMYNAMKVEYNPIENYDRIEEWTDTKQNAITDKEVTDGESKENISNVVDSTRDENHYVAGYNEPSMVQDFHDKTDTDTEDTTETSRTVDNTVTRNGSGNEDAQHRGRVHGNIGVTTSQQMLESELNLAPRLNIVDYIVESFKMRFCVLVY